MARAVGRPRQDEADLAVRQAEILNAAAHAFMDQGFAATTLDRVADRLGATKGAVYYYYRSKSDLFFAVHRRAMELTRAALEPAATGAGGPRFYVGVIEEGAAAGLFRAVDARLLAKPVLGALNWTSRWYQPRPGETPDDRNRIAVELAEFVVRALAR